MKKIIFLFLVIFSFCKMYSQKDYANLIIGKEDEVELSFQIYDSLVIKKDYTKFEDVINDSPENQYFPPAPARILSCGVMQLKIWFF